MKKYVASKYILTIYFYIFFLILYQKPFKVNICFANRYCIYNNGLFREKNYFLAISIESSRKLISPEVNNVYVYRCFLRNSTSCTLLSSKLSILYVRCFFLNYNTSRTLLSSKVYSMYAALLISFNNLKYEPYRKRIFMYAAFFGTMLHVRCFYAEFSRRILFVR